MQIKRYLTLIIVIFFVIIIIFYPTQIILKDVLYRKYFNNFVAKIEFFCENNKAIANGIVINKNQILTVAHTFKNTNYSYERICDCIYVHINNLTYLPTDIRFDFDRDLCLLTVSSSSLHPVELSYRINKSAYVIVDSNNYEKIKITSVTNVIRELSLIPMITIDQRFEKGKSGLPVVNSLGAVIGILTANDKFYNRSYVIPAVIIEKFLTDLQKQ